MRRLRLRRQLCALAGAALLGGGSGAANAAEPDALAQLLEAGRYQEACELAMSEDAAHRGEKLARVARALLKDSIGSRDSFARWFGLRAARSLREVELADAARGAMAEADPYEQSLALEILANTDPQGSREVFLTALDSPFRSARLRALRALADLKDPTLIRRFEQTLTTDADPDLRVFAARALTATGSVEAIPALYRALDDNAALVQEEAIDGLVALKDREIAGVLRRRLAEQPLEGRARVVRLLGLVPDLELTEVLGPLLTDGNAEVRTAAAAAILSILERSTTGAR